MERIRIAGKWLRGVPALFRDLSLPKAALASSVGLLAIALLVLWLTGRPDGGPWYLWHIEAMSWKDRLTYAAAVATGVGALVALVVSYRKQRDAEEGKFAAQFAAAAAQLGDDAPAVRIAGAFAIAALADGHEARRQQCIDVLTGYLRLPYAPQDGHRTGRAIQYEVDGEDGVHSMITDTNAYRPADREVRRTIIRIIRDHLQDPAERTTWCRRELDFTGATFDGGDFRGSVFVGDGVLFHDCSFVGGNMAFDGAFFSGGIVGFDRSVFIDGLVSFRQTHFTGDGGVELIDARLRGSKVSFEDAEIQDGFVSFHASRLERGSISFKCATIDGGSIDFSKAVFRGSQVTFGSRGRYDPTTLRNGEISFDSATFVAGRLSFRQAYLTGGSILFGDATISGGRIVFDSAQLAGSAVIFGNPPEKSYRPTRLRMEEGQVSFYASTLDGSHVDFRGAELAGGEIDFREAAFAAGSVNFDSWTSVPGCRIKGTDGKPFYGWTESDGLLAGPLTRASESVTEESDEDPETRLLIATQK